MRVLECIKHFFSVDHVIFVTAIDRNALDASIHAVYGNRIDVDGYLRKFFDYHVELSLPTHEAFSLLLAKSLRLEEAIPRGLSDRVEFFANWSRILNLPLRVQEQILSQANFVIRTHESYGKWFVCELILLLLCVRAKDAAAFDRLATGEMQLQDMLSELKSLIGRNLREEELNNIVHSALEILIVGFVPPQTIVSEYQEARERLRDGHKGLSDLERQNLESYMDIWHHALKLSEERPRRFGPSVVRRIRFLTE